MTKKPWPSSRRGRVVAVSTAFCIGVASSLSGCATLPGHSDPKAIRSYAPGESGTTVPGPQKGDAPDEVLRGFFSASAHPSHSHKAARAFLTSKSSDSWKDGNDAFIVQQLNINSSGTPSDNEATFDVSGSTVGVLGDGGTFTPRSGRYRSQFKLKKVNGEWRISSVPEGIILQSIDFEQTYRAYSVYFLDHTGRYLVSDRRWIYSQQDTIESSLMSLLASGPRQELAPGIGTALPEGTSITAKSEKDGGSTVDIKGLSQVSSDDCQKIAGQVVWTLIHADVRGPFTLMADGAPLLDQAHKSLSASDVANLNPEPPEMNTLHAVANGNIVTISDSGAAVDRGPFGHAGSILSAGITPNGGLAAAVERDNAGGDEGNDQPGNGTSVLRIGHLMDTDAASRKPAEESDEAGQPVVRGQTLTRPSWSEDGTVAWTVADGKEIHRVEYQTGTDSKSMSGSVKNEYIVDNDALRGQLRSDDDGDDENNDHKISEFRVANDGVRAAMIIGGRVFTAIIAPGEGGKRRIMSPRELGEVFVGDTATSVDWQPDGSLLIGTQSQDAPIWSVQPDGSDATRLTSNNVQAPVSAVASTRNQLYITDSRSVLQLERNNSSDTATQNWREVPGLQGVRAQPIVSR
ncbi:MtrAB system accessory lipoprotein LpqB [uncultured Corynebacterium sp.]|uniref:MtrAB system accessory lipoprotein LpqB n=1 Tax=uncultured Corynebacterium sp. TaxID=159447 RepID=UPI0025DB86C0|nr:MtrAB system accessory lipoprotein LpqB [uncultured Corynebacterium sp.]